MKSVATIKAYKLTYIGNASGTLYYDLEEAENAYAKELAETIARDYNTEDVKLEPVELGFCNMHGYSDIHPLEIVRVVSNKTLELRRVEATLDPNFKCDVSIGGFVGHTNNNHAQSYTYEADTEAPTIRVRRDKNGNWKNHGAKFYLSTEPEKFHDYNF